jgi:hypothetical protein
MPSDDFKLSVGNPQDLYPNSLKTQSNGPLFQSLDCSHRYKKIPMGSSNAATRHNRSMSRQTSSRSYAASMHITPAKEVSNDLSAKHSSVKQVVLVLNAHSRSESLQQSRASSSLGLHSEGKVLRQSYRHCAEAIKSTHPPLQETFYNLGPTLLSQPKRLQLGELAACKLKPSRPPVGLTRKRTQSFNLECCEACNELKSVFFKGM